MGPETKVYVQAIPSKNSSRMIFPGIVTVLRAPFTFVVVVSCVIFLRPMFISQRLLLKGSQGLCSGALNITQWRLDLGSVWLQPATGGEGRQTRRLNSQHLRRSIQDFQSRHHFITHRCCHCKQWNKCSQK